jgi:hypothetical protein
MVRKMWGSDGRLARREYLLLLMRFPSGRQDAALYGRQGVRRYVRSAGRRLVDERGPLLHGV